MARWWHFSNLLDNFEARMDSFSPKVEVIEKLQKKYSKEEFEALMDRLSSERGLGLKSKEVEGYIFTVNGWKFGDRQDTRDIFANDAIAELFMDSKSRFECCLLEDGTVQISSFEHVPGPKHQRGEFKLVLDLRLKQLLKLIDQ